MQEQLLAGIADHLAVANWQRPAIWSEKARQQPAPRPIVRPGVEDPDEHFGGQGMSIADLERRLSRAR